MMKKTAEILAPAGGPEQLKAAVRCGANAVYLGMTGFNARRGAENFPDQALFEAVRYCHLHSVKVYVTLNTLVLESERPALYRAAFAIAESGADAVLVQDFAAAKALREVCPDLPLHASTQMAVHNEAGVRFLREHGFSRAVLARELTLAEIKKITKNAGMETEVFVHGAHCVSVSGCCYLSSTLGGRSGNRGLCAQPCRLNFRAGEKEYALSLKDMSLLSYVGELADAGVASLKIEGRLKRPEYVAAAVTACKKAISGEDFDSETLRSVFSRGGFTDGFLTGRRDKTMFGIRSKEDVAASNEVLKSLSSLYADEKSCRSLSFTLILKKGKPTLLSAESDGFSAVSSGEEGQRAQKEPLSAEYASRSLQKLGGTPFFMEKAELLNPDGLMLPVSALNALRRDVTEKLCAKMTEVSRASVPKEPSKELPHTPKGWALRARFSSFSQITSDFSVCESWILGADELLREKEKTRLFSDKLICEVPSVIWPENEEEWAQKLRQVRALGVTKGAAGNIGGLMLLREAGFEVFGLHRLNITNEQSLLFFAKQGLTDAVLSAELPFSEMKRIGGSLSRGAVLYGRLPLMVFRVCPVKCAVGCKKCGGKGILTDRKGVSFPVRCGEKRYTELLNSVPLCCFAETALPLDFGLLWFTVESSAECQRVLRLFLNREKPDFPHTKGLYPQKLP